MQGIFLVQALVDFEVQQMGCFILAGLSAGDDDDPVVKKQRQRAVEAADAGNLQLRVEQRDLRHKVSLQLVATHAGSYYTTCVAYVEDYHMGTTDMSLVDSHVPWDCHKVVYPHKHGSLP